MPELPDLELYCRALRERLVGQRLERVRIVSPALLRSVDPPIDAVEGLAVEGCSRLAKRIVIGLCGERFLVIHLMIAGRLRWAEGGERGQRPGPLVSAEFRLPRGVLSLTEASTQKRATLHVVDGRTALAAHDPGGLEPLEASTEAIVARLRATNRTLKRALTDPATLAGIGNAYSDEILHAARLSPLTLTGALNPGDATRLVEAMRSTLATWTARLAEEFAGRFPGPGAITAFRPGFAVHGRFGQPCPVCGTSVQRIVRGEHETNYCPRCQTGGKLLADRSLSRLLHDDWPATIDAWEAEGPHSPGM